MYPRVGFATDAKPSNTPLLFPEDVPSSHRSKSLTHDKLSTKLRTTATMTKSEDAVYGYGYSLGLVVWARQENFPWWPAVVIDRKEREKNVLVEHTETLPAAAIYNRLVKFFPNDGEKVAVLEVDDLLEYSTNLHKVSRAGDADINNVIDACEKANAYIDTKGLSAQRKSLKEKNFVAPEKKPERALMPGRGPLLSNNTRLNPPALRNPKHEPRVEAPMSPSSRPRWGRSQKKRAFPTAKNDLSSGIEKLDKTALLGHQSGSDEEVQDNIAKRMRKSSRTILDVSADSEEPLAQRRAQLLAKLGAEESETESAFDRTQRAPREPVNSGIPDADPSFEEEPLKDVSANSKEPLAQREDDNTGNNGAAEGDDKSGAEFALGAHHELVNPSLEEVASKNSDVEVQGD